MRLELLKNNYTKSFLLLVLFLVSTLQAQFSELASLDYTHLPGNSGIQYTRQKLSINYPLKLKKKGSYLLLGIEYTNINLNFEDETFSFERNQISDFQIIDFQVGYTQKLKNNWRVGARATSSFSSNNDFGTISLNKLIFSSLLIFIKERKIDKIKKERIILGVSYSQTRGFPFPLPFVSYYKRFHEHWSYKVGIPSTNFQYRLSDQHRFKLFATLDGFTSNVVGELTINNEQINRINMSVILSGIQYEFHFLKYLELFIKTAYNFSVRTNLRNDTDNIFTLDDDTKLYFKTGIRFKI